MRAVVIAVRIPEMAGVGIAPTGVSVRCVETLHDLLVADTMMQHQPPTENRWRAIARADGFFPDNRRAAGRPFIEQPGFVGFSVRVRTEELRPVLGRDWSNGGQPNYRHEDSKQRSDLHAVSLDDGVGCRKPPI